MRNSLPVDDRIDATVNERKEIENETQLIDGVIVTGQAPLDDDVQQESRSPANQEK
jgi:hypothetical protein